MDVKKKRDVRNIYIHTTKIIKIYINQSNDYYTFLELAYAPNFTTFYVLDQTTNKV